MEDLQARHRKEQRDLQSRVTQKKKQASKKTRKGVNDECEQLEAVLREKHAAEIAALDGDPDATTQTDVLSEPLEELTLKVEDEDASHRTNGTQPAQDDVSEPTPTPQAHDEGPRGPQTKKPNKAKARLVKRALEQEEQARQAAEEAKTLPDLKSQERARMLEYMTSRGLREKEIRADGHCLYAAVADQLEQLEIPIGSAPGVEGVPAYRAVRAAAAEYIERHPDDFEAFLEEPLEGYLCKIRETGEWGGQLELMALAKAYGVEINVLQDFGRVEKIEAGAGDEEMVMWLGYYKHGLVDAAPTTHVAMNGMSLEAGRATADVLFVSYADFAVRLQLSVQSSGSSRASFDIRGVPRVVGDTARSHPLSEAALMRRSHGTAYERDHPALGQQFPNAQLLEP
ncbi:OTU protein [Friedmanniomyces endolithicus]|nr:OTU protein [Friedmanniomyces endolithicus]